MKSVKIIFLFNQLLTSELKTGGEIRGKTILDFFKKDQQFKTEVITPNLSKNIFKESSKHIIGNNFLEKSINPEKSIYSLILFCSRTFETIKKRSKFKSDIIYSTGDFFCNVIPAIFIKKLFPKTKLVVVIHHINDKPFQRKTTSFLAGCFSYYSQQINIRLIKKHFDLVFVVNSQVKQYLANLKLKQPIIVSNNGLDIKKIENISKLFIHTKPQNHICYFGRVTTSKGSLDLPIILSKIKLSIPSIHLDIIGAVSPDIQNKLINKFTEYQCQNNYTLYGFVQNQSDVYQIISNSKVIIFPSYEEGWGISLFESVMSQRPVVAYNLPIFKEIFDDKLITAPVGNTSSLAKKTIGLIKNYNHQSTQSYIKECYTIAKKYTWKNVFIKEKRCINKLLNSSF